MRFSQFILLPLLAFRAVEASRADNLNEVAQSGPSPGGAGHRRSAEPEPDARSGPSPKGPGHRRDVDDIDQIDQSGPSPRGRGH
ncbi:hypothetical protein J7T55_013335 [Diaporthe amygdali]|uniref:uncharacterized protein n=1 Tax=Phomopsis amygdali TaxID=1214568 RepID=UPI0022FDED2C|nr:uncharacterized protein J7T55_013335 [Diaporthe amygdali]KAJ0119100.1 hypothetical protein J7T55_013335 [Diaporthe amygdali]